MSHTPNDLASEFPGDTEILHALKATDNHFDGLTADYERLNQQIVRIETGLEAASDERLEVLKKQRLALLDHIAGHVAAARV